MALWANVLKGIQYGSIGLLVDWALVLDRLYDPQYAFLGLSLLVFGQHLNAAVYWALGQDGVYYGNRFGKSIPWVYSYPYSVWAGMHPQYLGCLASLLGSYVLGVPQEILGWWAANYVYLMWLESRDPGVVSIVG
jgi:hypothetical protein